MATHFYPWWKINFKKRLRSERIVAKLKDGHVSPWMEEVEDRIRYQDRLDKNIKD